MLLGRKNDGRIEKTTRTQQYTQPSKGPVSPIQLIVVERNFRLEQSKHPAVISEPAESYRFSFLNIRSGMLRMMNMMGWKMPGT